MEHSASNTSNGAQTKNVAPCPLPVSGPSSLQVNSDSRQPAKVIQFEWSELKTTRGKTESFLDSLGCVGCLGAIFFPPLLILVGIGALISKLIGPIQSKERVTYQASFCSACRHRLFGATAVICIDCRSQLDGIEIRRFETATEKDVALAEFSVAP